MSGKDHSHPNLAPTEMAIRIGAVAPTGSSQLAGVAGTLVSIGKQMRPGFKPGDEVLACLHQTSTNAALHPGETTVVNGSLVCTKPPRIDVEAAAHVAQTLALSAKVIAKCLSHFEQSESGESGKRGTIRAHTMLITGGETLTGAVLAYLLKRKVVDAQVYMTCAGDNDEELSEIASRLVGYVRAVYAIDADAPDLLEHLQNASKHYNGIEGVDLLVDLVGLVARRAELMELLVGHALFVDGEALNAEDDVMGSLKQSTGTMAMIGSLLHDMPAELLRL